MTDHHAQGRTAFESGDLNTALLEFKAATDENPADLPSHYMIGRCFVQGKRFAAAFQVYSALLLHPECRGHVELDRRELDLLVIEGLVLWAYEIEATGFPENERLLFEKAVEYYSQEAPQHTVALVGLSTALNHHRKDTAVFDELLRAKSQQGSLPVKAPPISWAPKASPPMKQDKPWWKFW